MSWALENATLVFETCLKLGKLQCKSNFNRNQVLLLTIDNFETNQIVLYLLGGYIMHLETTCHVSHVTCHFLTIPKPYHHVSCVPYHMSDVTFHLSLVMYHISGVTYHTFFLLFFFQKVVELVGGGSVINGAYPVQFLDFFLLKTH